jgi:hypothetical protein
MTMGGTRYFIGLLAKENGIAALPATDHNMPKSTAVPRARQASVIIA